MPETIHQSTHIVAEREGGSVLVCLMGDWTLDNAIDIHKALGAFDGLCKTGGAVDCSAITNMDTSGAVLVRRLAACAANNQDIELTGIKPEHQNLLGVIKNRPPEVQTEPDRIPPYLVPLAELGEAATGTFWSFISLTSFLGLVLVHLMRAVIEPSRLRPIPILHQMDVVGLRSMGIVGLISFLIGAVMVNQGAIQLAKFGADIFVVDMLGIAHLRELGILLTAIIIAGRSGSAFTAQIGSMVLHEEVDAMKTLGMDPIDVLVLPRLIALLICLPLLTFYADVLGIAGGALMAWMQLDITPANFLVYFRDVISIDHYWVGVLKAPFFAAVIATCGCYQGLRVTGSADALGARTTRSVVQSIFLVIALDALFAIFFTAMGL